MRLFNKGKKDPPADASNGFQHQGTYKGNFLATRFVFDENHKLVGTDVQIVNKKTGEVEYRGPSFDKPASSIPQDLHGQAQTVVAPTKTVAPAGGSVGDGQSAYSAPAPAAAEPKKKVIFKTAANGDLLQKAEGGNWYVAKDNSPASVAADSGTPDAVDRYVDNHNQNLSPPDAVDRYLANNQSGEVGRTDAHDRSPDAVDRHLANHKPAEVGRTDAHDRSPDGVDRYLANHKPAEVGRTDAHDRSPDAVDRALNNHTPAAGGVPDYTDAHDRSPDAVDRAVGNLSPEQTWHANPNWEAPNAEAKSAIGQIASGVNTDDILETRAGANNNYLLRMKDGTYKSVDLSSGNVSGAGTWNNNQWADSQYSAEQSAPAIAAAAPAPAPAAPATTSYSDEVEATNLTRQWAEQHHHDEAPAPAAAQPSTVDANVVNNAYANQYSGIIDMDEINRSVAELTLPGVNTNEAAVEPPFQPPSGGDSMRVPGRGRFLMD